MRIRKIQFKVLDLIENLIEKHDYTLTGLQFNLSNQPAILKREDTSANLGSLGNMTFLKALFIICTNIGKYLSRQSIRTFTGIHELMADFFLYKDFVTFFTSLDNPSFQ